MYNLMYSLDGFMVRKQIYLEDRQEARLKRVARARGVSEAAVIRQAIDRQVLGVAVETHGGDPTVWESALRFMRSLAARPRKGREGRTWKREDAYAERLSRHGRHPA